MRYGSTAIMAPASAPAAMPMRASAPAAAPLAISTAAAARPTAIAEPRSEITIRPQSTAAAAPTGRIASRQSRGGCFGPERTAAANTQSATLASSDGCSVKPPGRLSQRCAPLRCTPVASTSTSSRVATTSMLGASAATWR